MENRRNIKLLKFVSHLKFPTPLGQGAVGCLSSKIENNSCDERTAIEFSFALQTGRNVCGGLCAFGLSSALIEIPEKERRIAQLLQSLLATTWINLLGRELGRYAAKSSPKSPTRNCMHARVD